MNAGLNQQCEVYPRVCGGTHKSGIPRLAIFGLSPRVRGNPAARQPEYLAERSIPACAGEPMSNAPCV